MDKRLDAFRSVIVEERVRRRGQVRAAVILAVSIALGIGALAYGLKEVARSQPAPAAVDLSKLPPIRPGPQR